MATIVRTRLWLLLIPCALSACTGPSPTPAPREFEQTQGEPAATHALDAIAVPGEEPQEFLESFDLVEASMADWVAKSPVVVKVWVRAEGSPRFNTEDGQRPTPDAGGDQSGYVIFRPVLLHVLGTYKDATSPDTPRKAFVVSRSGGSLDGFTYRIEPEERLEVGLRGVAFLEDMDSELLRDPPLWVSLLFDHASRWSGERSGWATPMLLSNWYRFEGDAAISDFEGRRIPVAQFHSEIEAAFGAP